MNTVFRRLRLHLTAVCAAVTGLVLVAMAAVSFSIPAGQLREQAEERFNGSLSTVFSYLKGQALVSHTWLAETEAANNLLIAVESGGNRLLYTGLDPHRAELTARALEIARDSHGFNSLVPPANRYRTDTVTFLMNSGGQQYRAAVAKITRGEGWLCVVVLGVTEQARLHRLIAVFALCVAAAVALLVAFSWLFSARALRPVEESRRRQTEFVSAASHELRSPLSVMQVSAEGIKDSPPEMHGRFADIILRECARLTRLTGDLLGLAGADSRGWSVSLARESPETILLRAYESFAPLAARKPVTLKTELPSPPLEKLLCDSQRVEQVLTILLDNALRYTPAGGTVELEVRRSGRYVCFMVADSGPGIPDSHKEAVFERFYRGDAARTDREHYGLGLAVAREIAAAHRGTLAAEDSGAGGACFVLRLPIRSK